MSASKRLGSDAPASASSSATGEIEVWNRVEFPVRWLVRVIECKKFVIIDWDDTIWNSSHQSNDEEKFEKVKKTSEFAEYCTQVQKTFTQLKKYPVIIITNAERKWIDDCLLESDLPKLNSLFEKEDVPIVSARDIFSSSKDGKTDKKYLKWKLEAMYTIMQAVGSRLRKIGNFCISISALSVGDSDWDLHALRDANARWEKETPKRIKLLDKAERAHLDDLFAVYKNTRDIDFDDLADDLSKIALDGSAQEQASTERVFDLRFLCHGLQFVQQPTLLTLTRQLQFLGANVDHFFTKTKPFTISLMPSRTLVSGLNHIDPRKLVSSANKLQASE